MNLNQVDVSKLPADIRKQYKQLQVMHAERKIQNKAKNDFLSFVKCVWPEFIEGAHHRHIAKKFNELAEGKINRLIVNMPPRHTKSEFASFLLPAWFLGKDPDKKVIQTAHTAELAVGFGRKVRNLFSDVDFRNIFPETSLQSDSKAAGRWNTNRGGEYFAIGVGGAVTGKGADLLIIDDPHSEQDAAQGQYNPEVFDRVYEWYTSGPRQRLQPGAAIVLVMTRWSTKDLTAMLLKNQKEVKGDQWEVVEFPAIMDHGPVWPEYWGQDELDKVKATLPVGKWNAQWMQSPTSEEGALIKREWWRKWEKDTPPDLHYVIQSYDTAFMKKETADYSAITTWAVFEPEAEGPEAIMLLDAKRVRLDFPELKKLAYDEYKYWEPDCVLIEAKASGTPLTQELRRMGIPVVAYTPSRGQDKIARMNSVAPIFESGMVWAPEEAFADEVIDEMAAFPFGEHDDFCDSATMALMRFRQGGFLSLESDYKDEAQFLNRGRVVYY